jgi:hypothetical protein
MNNTIHSEAKVKRWWVEIRGEAKVIPARLRIAEAVGRELGLSWVVGSDPQGRSDVRCIRSDVRKVSLSSEAFKRLRDKVGQRLEETLASWVSIAIRCDVADLDNCLYETPGAESVI